MESDIAARNAIIARAARAEEAVKCTTEEMIKRGIDVNADPDEWYDTGC